jgi:hypothetical protein
VDRALQECDDLLSATEGEKMEEHLGEPFVRAVAAKDAAIETIECTTVASPGCASCARGTSPSHE